MRRGDAGHKKLIRFDVATDEEAGVVDPVRRRGPRAGRLERQAWKHDPLDVIPCTSCGLRGHLAGDADRCLPRWYAGSMGMGQATFTNHTWGIKVK